MENTDHLLILLLVVTVVAVIGYAALLVSLKYGLGRNTITANKTVFSPSIESFGVNTSHFDMLGKKAKDKVTGFTGVVTTLSYDLYGCIQVVVSPEAKDGEIKLGHWCDVSRIEILSDEPVMQLPDFNEGYISEGLKGCAEKPAI